MRVTVKPVFPLWESDLQDEADRFSTTILACCYVTFNRPCKYFKQLIFNFMPRCGSWTPGIEMRDVKSTEATSSSLSVSHVWHTFIIISSADVSVLLWSGFKTNFESSSTRLRCLPGGWQSSSRSLPAPKLLGPQEVLVGGGSRSPAGLLVVSSKHLLQTRAPSCSTKKLLRVSKAAEDRGRHGSVILSHSDHLTQACSHFLWFPLTSFQHLSQLFSTCSSDLRPSLLEPTGKPNAVSFPLPCVPQAFPKIQKHHEIKGWKPTLFTERVRWEDCLIEMDLEWTEKM